MIQTQRQKPLDRGWGALSYSGHLISRARRTASTRGERVPQDFQRRRRDGID